MHDRVTQKDAADTFKEEFRPRLSKALAGGLFFTDTPPPHPHHYQHKDMNIIINGAPVV